MSLRGAGYWWDLLRSVVYLADKVEWTAQELALYLCIWGWAVSDPVAFEIIERFDQEAHREEVDGTSLAWWAQLVKAPPEGGTKHGPPYSERKSGRRRARRKVGPLDPYLPHLMRW